MSRNVSGSKGLKRRFSAGSKKLPISALGHLPVMKRMGTSGCSGRTFELPCHLERSLTVICFQDPEVPFL